MTSSEPIILCNSLSTEYISPSLKLESKALIASINNIIIFVSVGLKHYMLTINPFIVTLMNEIKWI